MQLTQAATGGAVGCTKLSHFKDLKLRVEFMKLQKYCMRSKVNNINNMKKNQTTKFTGLSLQYTHRYLLQLGTTPLEQSFRGHSVTTRQQCSEGPRVTCRCTRTHTQNIKPSLAPSSSSSYSSSFSDFTKHVSENVLLCGSRSSCRSTNVMVRSLGSYFFTRLRNVLNLEIICSMKTK